MDPKYNVTNTEGNAAAHKAFELIRKACTSTTLRIANLEITLESLLNDNKINFVNCNQVNLFAEAIASRVEPAIALFRKLAPEELDNATAISKKLIKGVENYVYPDGTDAPVEAAEDLEEAPAIPSKSIFDAAQDGDIDVLNKILTQNSELVNSVDNDGWTASEIAAYNGNLAALKLLVENYQADTSKLPHPVLLGAFPEIINYMLEQNIISKEDLAIKAVEDPQYLEATGPIIATIEGVNYRLSVKGTALHHAIGVGNVAVAAKLLEEHHADPEVLNDAGDKAIHYAVRTEQKTSFDLLKDRCNVNSTNTVTGDNILHMAESIEMLEHIIDSVPKDTILELATTVNDAGNNPARQYASIGDNGGMLGCFLEKVPADQAFKESLCNAPGEGGRSVLDIAREQKGIQEILASKGIEVRAIEQEDASAEDEGGRHTPEPIEVSNPSVNVTPTKTSQRASEPTTPMNTPGRKTAPNTPKTPMVPKKSHQEILGEMLQAIDSDDGDTIAEILNHHPDLDFINVQLQAENSPAQQNVNLLEMAHRHNKHKALDALVKHWMPENLIGLIQAVQNDDAGKISELIKSDQDIKNIKITKESSTVDNYKGLKLCEFKHKGLKESLSFYLSYKAELNTLSMLQFATLMDKAHSVQTLLDAGADTDYQDDKGYTALHHAVESESGSSIWMLLSREGSNAFEIKTHRTHGQQTPMEMAAYMDRKSIFPHFYAKAAEDEQAQYRCLLSAIKGGSINIVSDILNQSSKFLSYYSPKTKVNTFMEMVKAKNKIFAEIISNKKFTSDFEKIINPSNTSHKDAEGKNILHYIAEYGNQDTLASFLGKYINEFNSLVQEKDAKGNYPLYLAANRDDITYNAFKTPLSKYTTFQKTTTGVWPFKKETKTSIVQKLPLDQADHIHKQYLQSFEYSSIKGSVSDLSGAGNDAHESEAAKLLAEADHHSYDDM